MTQQEEILSKLSELINWKNSIELNKKKTSDLDSQSTLETESLLRVENSLGVSKFILISQIIEKIFGDWKWIEGGFAVKGAGKEDLESIEETDVRWFAEIPNNGESLMLVGDEYLGGDKDLAASYQKKHFLNL